MVRCLLIGPLASQIGYVRLFTCCQSVVTDGSRAAQYQVNDPARPAPGRFSRFTGCAPARQDGRADGHCSTVASLSQRPVVVSALSITSTVRQSAPTMPRDRSRCGPGRRSAADPPPSCRPTITDPGGIVAARRSSSVALALAIPGGTGNAWASPQAAETTRRLVFEGGFVVDGGRDRRLQERTISLGFDDLRGYLRARCDAGTSRIADQGWPGW